ncbi:ABC transporter substrate-binding protein [Scytonema sp. NUACC26]|uniref:ABC transporter substrate-binding protein n=1 Tax=Scytonema sp. NUACC26 TaxID=3140176 RepID=UPI0034DB87F6
MSNYTEEQKITELWYTRCPVPTISGIALDLGWLDKTFAKDGISFKSLRAEQERSVRESHFDHTLKGLFREGGNIPAIWARATGKDTRAIALTWVDEYQAILTLPDSADITQPVDLRGRRLAIPLRTQSQIDFSRAMALRGFLSALSLAGLNENDVQFVDLHARETDLQEPLSGGIQQSHFYQRELAGLFRGEVDAIYVKGAPGADLSVIHKLRVVFDLGKYPDPLVRVNNGTPRTITVNADLVEQRPDLIVEYLACLLQTSKWAETHSEDVVRTVSVETGGSEEAVRKAYGSELHLRLRPDLSKQWIAALNSQKDFLLKWGFIPADFDIDAWIAPKYLAEAQKLVSKLEESALI